LRHRPTALDRRDLNEIKADRSWTWAVLLLTIALGAFYLWLLLELLARHGVRILG
jgi:hypothetical protein